MYEHACSVCPNLRLEDWQSSTKRLHESNSQVPRSQRRITVDVLEGENVDDVAQNNHLGSFALTRDDAEVWTGDAGGEVEVHMGLDADGVIHAMAHDVQSGKTNAISLNRNS